MKFKPYEEYKKVDLPWIDEIPSHWGMKKIKYLFNERNERDKEGEPLLVASQKYGVILKSMYENRTVEAQRNLESLKYVNKGDFVISLRSFQGGIEYAYYSGIISPAYTVMIPKEEILSRYFKHLAKSYNFIKLLETCVTGIREGQNIDYNKLKSKKIFLPPKEEQDKIADFLDHNLAKIDKFVELTERQIELLKEQKEVIINDAVTKGIDKDVEYKDSGIDWIGEIPEHWEVTRLKYVANINPSIQADIGTMDFNNKLVFLAMEDISENGELNQNNFKKLKEVKTGYTAFKKEDVIVAKITPCFENGKGSYLKKLKTNIGYGTTELVVLRKTDKIYGEYLYRVTKSHLFRKKGEMMMKGSAGQKRITSEFLNSFKLGLPPKKEQEEIVAYIEKETRKIDRTIELYKNQIELIKEYRTSLIASAVTGKIDIRDF